MLLPLILILILVRIRTRIFVPRLVGILVLVILILMMIVPDTVSNHDGLVVVTVVVGFGIFGFGLLVSACFGVWGSRRRVF